MPESVRQGLLEGRPIKFQENAPDADRHLPADWIAEAVSKSARIEIHNAVISGPLVLHHQAVAKEFGLIDCHVKDRADFSDVAFEENISLSGTTFHEDADFSAMKCGAVADFTRVLFRKRANFSLAKVNGIIIFLNAVFEGSAIFFGIEVARDAFFNGAQFNRKDEPASFTFAQIKCGAYFTNSFFAGGVDFYGVRVGGEVHFAKAQFNLLASFKKTHVIGTARFDDAVFEGEADFSGMQFGDDAIFQRAKFMQKDKAARFDSITTRGALAFSGAVFAGEALFRGVHVGSQAQFQAARFEGAFSLNGARIEDSAVFGSLELGEVPPARFEGEADLSSTYFAKNAEFDGVSFNGHTWFSRTVICGAAMFRNAKFSPGSEPVFYRTKFLHGAIFSGCEFPDKTDIRSAEFLGEAAFHGSIFVGSSHFDGSRFAGLAVFGHDENGRPVSFDHVSFNHARFEQDAWFEGTIFKQTVSLRESSFRTLFFSPTGQVDGAAQFQASVDLRGCKYDGIHVCWKSLCRRGNGVARLEPYERQPYAQLERTLRTLGRDDEADDVYLERRRVERWQKRGISRVGDWIYWLGANYGVRPYQLFWIAIILIAWGTLVFQSYGAGRSGEASCPVMLNLAEAARLSLREFLPVELPILRDCEVSDRHWLFLRFSDWAALLKLTGWVIVPVGIAALAGLLRRGASSERPNS